MFLTYFSVMLRELFVDAGDTEIVPTVGCYFLIRVDGIKKESTKTIS